MSLKKPYAVYNRIIPRDGKRKDSVTIAAVTHLYPFRTQKLSPPTPKVLVW